MPRVAFATPFILHKTTMDFIGLNKGGSMRQRVIIASLFFISTLVLSGCATHFGANVACNLKTGFTPVSTTKQPTGRTICKSTPNIGYNTRNGQISSVYGMPSETVCEPEYEIVYNQKELDKIKQTCMKSKSKNK